MWKEYKICSVSYFAYDNIQLVNEMVLVGSNIGPFLFTWYALNSLRVPSMDRNG
jgi:hypothetical protein